MLYAVRIALERESQGKRTAFLIRGRIVTFEEVQHYFYRKGVRDLKSLLEDAADATPTTRIQCHTPEPTSIAAERMDRQIRSSKRAAGSMRENIGLSNSRVMIIPDSNQVVRVLRDSPEIGQLNQLLHYDRDYYNSLFDGRDWRTQQNSFDLGSLESFYHSIFDGHALLDSGRIKAAFRHFDLAFGLIKGILEKETLLFLPYLYYILLLGREFQKQEVFLKMLHFTSQMIRTIFPHLRPVQDSLVLLYGMSPEQRGYCCSRAFESVLDQLKDAFYNRQPDEGQLQRAATVLCSWVPRGLDYGTQDVESSQPTSAAVWRLGKKGDMFVDPTTDRIAVQREEDGEIGRLQHELTIVTEYAMSNSLFQGSQASAERFFGCLLTSASYARQPHAKQKSSTSPQIRL
jgi:hypothetical protein